MITFQSHTKCPVSLRPSLAMFLLNSDVCLLGTLTVTCPNLNSCSPLKPALPCIHRLPLVTRGTHHHLVAPLSHSHPTSYPTTNPFSFTFKHPVSGHFSSYPLPQPWFKPPSCLPCSLQWYQIATDGLFSPHSGQSGSSKIPVRLCTHFPGQEWATMPAGGSSCSSDPTSYPSLPGSVSPATRLIPVPPTE